MRETLGPPRKNSVCFFWRMSNGYSDWLSQEDVDYLIDYVLTYDHLEVHLQPDLEKNGTWYGLRLKASKRETRSFVGQTTVSKEKDADTFYYFKDSTIRDKVIEAWTE